MLTVTSNTIGVEESVPIAKQFEPIGHEIELNEVASNSYKIKSKLEKPILIKTTKI